MTGTAVVFGRAQGGLGFAGVPRLSLSRDRADRSGPYRQSQGPEKAQGSRAGGDGRATRGRQGTGYGAFFAVPFATRQKPAARSEEHTSELQSLMSISYAGF